MFTAGLGYYTAMGRRNRNYFNLIAEAGIGKFSSTDDASPYITTRHRSYDANLLKLSFKPAFNFFFNEVFRMSVAPRFSFLKVDKNTTTYSAEEETLLGYSSAKNKFLPLIEPSIQLQFGPKSADWLKFDLGFNFSTNPLKGESDNETTIVVQSYDLYSRDFLFTFGISVYPHQKKK
jgi:hypothetical protein